MKQLNLNDAVRVRVDCGNGVRIAVEPCVIKGILQCPREGVQYLVEDTNGDRRYVHEADTEAIDDDS